MPGAKVEFGGWHPKTIREIRERRRSAARGQNRHTSKWTQDYVALKSGISQQAISEVENGRWCSPAIAEALAPVLGCDPDQLMIEHNICVILGELEAGVTAKRVNKVLQPRVNAMLGYLDPPRARWLALGDVVSRLAALLLAAQAEGGQMPLGLREGLLEAFGRMESCLEAGMCEAESEEQRTYDAFARRYTLGHAHDALLAGGRSLGLRAPATVLLESLTLEDD